MRRPDHFVLQARVEAVRYAMHHLGRYLDLSPSIYSDDRLNGDRIRGLLFSKVNNLEDKPGD